MTSRFKRPTPDNVVRISLAVFSVSGLWVFCWAVQYPLIIPLFLLFLAIHLVFSSRGEPVGRKASLKLFLNFGLLLALIVFTAHVVSHYTEMPLRYVPVAAIAILTMLLFNDLQLAFVMAFASSVLVSLVLGGDFGMMLTFFMGALAGAYTVRDARMRGQVIGAGVFVSLVHLACLVLLNPDYHLFLKKGFAIQYLYPLAANGFICAFLVIATLKVFEYLFGVLTNYSLLELADFNQPLLKRLILEAPGTYHHSLIVSNLAEGAADTIGANALLTRVGAYYHDIGKLVKAEYFAENQRMGYNKHDNIEPSMSRLVIFNHVTEGIELAQKHKLNPAIIDFIPQHHGTGLMYYFYQKAQEEAKEGETVDESGFRYPGPKPQTRETAITLLADSVEGATRSLDEHTPTKIEETVKKVINNKFIDGQLDECNLTLQEINKISSTFTRILSAMYHARIKYPEKKNGSTKVKGDAKDAPGGRKPSEESPDQA